MPPTHHLTEVGPRPHSPDVDPPTAKRQRTSAATPAQEQETSGSSSSSNDTPLVDQAADLAEQIFGQIKEPYKTLLSAILRTANDSDPNRKLLDALPDNLYKQKLKTLLDKIKQPNQTQAATQPDTTATTAQTEASPRQKITYNNNLDCEFLKNLLNEVNEAGTNQKKTFKKPSLLSHQTYL